MRLKRRAPHPPQETIITLIDVVFFLLIFFMLIGRMEATAPFEILPPISSNGADLPAGGMTVAVGRDGDLAIDGRPIDDAELAEVVASALADTPVKTIRINAHKDSELRHVLPLISQIETLGATDVVLVVTPKSP